MARGSRLLDDDDDAPAISLMALSVGWVASLPLVDRTPITIDLPDSD